MPRIISIWAFGLGVALAASSLRAQLIAISIEARDPDLGTAHAIILLDVNAPPVSNSATSVTFEAYDASMSVDFANFYAHGPGHAELNELRKASAAFVSYSTQEREILFTIDAPHCSLTFEVESPVGPFHPYMSSLPSNPTAYLFDGFDDQRVRVVFTETADEQTTLEGEARWTPADKFTGALAYTVRALPEPEPQRCSEADLAPPFGIVDFDDVLAFINAFDHACE